MKTLKLSEFSRNIELHLNDVTKSLEPIIIKSNKKKGIFIIALKEYNP